MHHIPFQQPSDLTAMNVFLVMISVPGPKTRRVLSSGGVGD